MSEIRRAIVKSYDAVAHKAAVQIAGSLAVWLDDVRVATNIPAADVVAGRQCTVLFLDPSNQDDAVVIAVQGALPSGGGGGGATHPADFDAYVDGIGSDPKTYATLAAAVADGAVKTILVQVDVNSETVTVAIGNSTRIIQGAHEVIAGPTLTVQKASVTVRTFTFTDKIVTWTGNDGLLDATFTATAGNRSGIDIQASRTTVRIRSNSNHSGDVVVIGDNAATGYVDNIIDQSLFFGTGIDGPSCIRIWRGADRTIVRDSQFIDTACSAHIITLDRNTSNTVGPAGTIIASCTFRDFDNGAIRLDGASNAVQSCLFDGVALAGAPTTQRCIEVGISTGGVTIIGNTVSRADVFVGEVFLSAGSIGGKAMVGNTIGQDVTYVLHSSMGNWAINGNNAGFNAASTVDMNGKGAHMVTGNGGRGNVAITNKVSTDRILGNRNWHSNEDFGHVLPDSDDTFDLGTDAKRISRLYHHETLWTEGAATLVNGDQVSIAILGIRETFVKITGPTAAFGLQGIGLATFVEPVDGEYLILWNSTSQNMTLRHEDAAATANLRIHTMTGADVVLAGESICELIYSPSISRWLLKSTTP